MSHLPQDETVVWNRAYARVSNYLAAFALTDRARTARLALEILDEARVLHRADPSRDPTALTMTCAQQRVTTWLETSLNEEGQPPATVLANGYIAMLLSQLAEATPTAFLASPLPEAMKQKLRATLVVTGPDLTISSMTPREMDYGPMLDLARQTWHRFDAKAFLTAALFWLGVYGLGYWILGEYL